MQYALLTLLAIFTGAAHAASDYLSPADYKLVMDSYHGSPQAKKVPTSSVPLKVKKAAENIEWTNELGDGYYSYASKLAYLEIRNSQKKLVGYLVAGLFSYTQDPVYTIAYNRLTVNGRRLNEETENYSDILIRDIKKEAPSWLQPDPSME